MLKRARSRTRSPRPQDAEDQPDAGGQLEENQLVPRFKNKNKTKKRGRRNAQLRHIGAQSA